MIIRSLTGDDQINEALNAAMHATLLAAAKEGAMTELAAQSFLNRHICLYMDEDGGFKGWLKRQIGAASKARIIIAEVK